MTNHEKENPWQQPTPDQLIALNKVFDRQDELAAQFTQSSESEWTEAELTAMNSELSDGILQSRQEFKAQGEQPWPPPKNLTRLNAVFDKQDQLANELTKPRP